MVGGIGVLLPLLEQVCEAEQAYNGGQEISDLLGPELTSPRSPAALLLPLNKSAGQGLCDFGKTNQYHECVFFCIPSANCVVVPGSFLCSCDNPCKVLNMIFSVVQNQKMF